MKFLVTGGAGFIGSNYMHYVTEKYPEDMFVCLDALTYAGNYNNIKDLEGKPNFRFVKGDIRNDDFIDGLFDVERFDYVINFAAESHVDNSIKDPNVFAKTNVLGTMNLMNAARKYGIVRFHQVSTDEVYGDLPLDRPDLLFTEQTPIHASSPYSASKASADLEVLAYARTFGLPVTISRCSNNYGPYQFPEKLIPVIISRALNNEKIPVYGKGENVRDWIHVYDHDVGVDMIVRHGRDGEIYNLGGHSERSNLEVVKTVLKELGKPESLIEFVTDRPGHDLRYATDSSKVEKELGWQPTHNFESGIKETVAWYQSHVDWIKNIESGAYRSDCKPKKIAIVGANDFQNKLIMKANTLGYETHVFAWQDGSIGERTADYFYPISIVEKEAILEKCREISPVAICTIASDLATLTVNYVAEELGLPGNPVAISEQCTNKYAMREAFVKNGVKAPKFVKVSADEKNFADILKGFNFPIIVKPTDRSGSRGITKLMGMDGIEAAVEVAAKESFEHCAIIEEFIEGDEYSCECITQNSKHHFLAFTKKYTTGSPHFIETGHAEPSDIPEELQASIKEEIFKALDALGVKNSASHTEFKVDKDGNFGIIEIGARMGGDCIGSDLVKLSTGNDFVKMVIDVAAGNQLELPEPETNFAIVKFVLSPDDLKKIQELNAANPDYLYFMSKIDKFDHAVTDSGTRMGFAIYRTDSKDIANKIKNMLFN